MRSGAWSPPSGQLPQFLIDGADQRVAAQRAAAASNLSDTCSKVAFMTTTHTAPPPQPRLPLLRTAQWATQAGGLFQPELTPRTVDEESRPAASAAGRLLER